MCSFNMLFGTECKKIQCSYCKFAASFKIRHFILTLISHYNMGKKIEFTKMHGAGNDYIYVNTLLYNIARPEEAAKDWSRYHFGVGSDGLVLIGAPSDPTKADYSMRIFNADGSEALMCGNASRCIGKYLYEKGLTDKHEIRLETLSGVKLLRLDIATDNTVAGVTVDMLAPAFVDETLYHASAGGRFTIDDRTFEGTFVSMGNPHFVIFVDDLAHLDIAHYGPLLEHHTAFPERCNIEFVEKTGEGVFRMRVWERGSGITLACGTGACATAVAAAHTGRAGRQSTIVMDGGELHITWNSNDNHVYMKGGATFAFDGTIDNQY